MKISCRSHEQGHDRESTGITACSPPPFLPAPFSVLPLASFTFFLYAFPQVMVPSSSEGKKFFPALVVLYFVWGIGVLKSYASCGVTVHLTPYYNCCEPPPHISISVASGCTSGSLSSQISLSPRITLGHPTILSLSSTPTSQQCP